MTHRTAKKWVVKKWGWMVEFAHRFRTRASMLVALRKAIPQIATFNACCAYCEKHFCHCGMCVTCPIVKAGYSACDNSNSIWDRWLKKPTKKNARAMLDMVKKT